MSLKEITKPETKLQEWSTLNCYSINAASAVIGQGDGLIRTVTNQFTVGDYSISSGSGTITQPQSIFNTWLVPDELFTFSSVSGSILITTPTAPYNATSGNSRMIVDLTLPFSIGYPAGFSNIVPGTVTGTCANGVNGNSMVSGQVIYASVNDVIFDICIPADISGGAISMSLAYSFTFQSGE